MPSERAIRSSRNKYAVASKVSYANLERFLLSAGEGRSTWTLPPKAIVYRQSDAADAVYYIQAGRIQLTVVSPQGKEGVIGMLAPGDFFGEACIAGQPLRTSSASATANSIVVRIEKVAMLRILYAQPAIAEKFRSFLLARNIQIEGDLVDQLFNSSELRLARLLLLLAHFGSEGTMDPIPSIRQETLAARVGTTRSRINFFMNKFRRLGYIEYKDGITVHPSLLNVIVRD